MGRIDKILHLLNELNIDETADDFSLHKEIGLTTEKISEKTGISRSNTSTLLNDLSDQHQVIKLSGRPVNYLSAELFIKLTGNKPSKSEYQRDEFISLIKKNKADQYDPFTTIIGFDGCLKSAVKQAKAAIMYPPNGLHTMLLGPSGVGKTFFANTMVEYARLSKGNDYPFMTFNCADYYSNPELLLSHLFGYAKGAFTGAESQKEGIVAKADGGILFLDEIHRLPAAGQEMLFTLMDKGVYSRLGDSDIHHANVLIIGATTENPNERLLKTFMRRIPVTINLPPLVQRPANERTAITEHLFIKEASRIGKKLKVSASVMNLLSAADLTGNIGELKSDIKQICASAFLRQMNNQEFIEIHEADIPDILSAQQQISKDSNDNDLIIQPNEQIKSYKIPTDTIYERIKKLSDNLILAGSSAEEINSQIAVEVEKYIRKLKQKYNRNDAEETEALSKIIEPNIIKFCQQSIEYAKKQLKKEFDASILWAMAFHFNALIKRNSSILEAFKPSLNLQNQYKEEYAVAALILKHFEDEFKLHIDPLEINFLCMFLTEKEVLYKTHLKSCLLILCHGKTTASSMADVCNNLLNTDLVKAINMPLTMGVEDTYQQVHRLLKQLNPTDGVLLFTDMGSLCQFSERLNKDLKLEVISIDNVSTLFVLEALRRVLFKNETIKETAKAINQLKGINMVRADNNLNKSILITCTTGIGTANLLKQKVDQFLIQKNISDIKTDVFAYVDILNNTDAFKQFCIKHDVIACAGNMNPNISAVYFGIEEIMLTSNTGRFEKFLESYIQKPTNAYDQALSLLKMSTRALNCDLAVQLIYDFNCRLAIDFSINTQALQLKIAVHLGYAIERMLINQLVQFTDCQAYLQTHKHFVQKLRIAVLPIENEFQINFNDDELCFLIQIVESALLEKGDSYDNYKQ